jgi:hypothetical protein
VRAGSTLGRGVAVALATTLLLASGELRAEDDGSYGRVEGDLGLSLEGAVREAFPGEALVGRLAASYLHTAGLYLDYAEGLGGDQRPLDRSISGGVEIRPLFLGRFAQDMERGPAFADLWIDSWALRLGAYGAWLGPGRCDGCRSHGLELASGFELPLLGRIDSPFIGIAANLRLRLDEDRSDFEPDGMVTLGLGYRFVISSGLVDAGDARAP